VGIGNSNFRMFVFFFIFAVSNALLSYFTLTIEAELWIFLLGILIPAIFYGYSKRMISKEGSEDDRDVSMWLWIAVFSLGLFLRLYHSTDLCAWPTRDEGIASFASLEFFRTGKPFFFSACGEWPPFYGWLQYLYFEWAGPSLNAFWRFPLFISIATLPVVYAAARQYFSKKTSFLIFGLACVEFWPAFLGRFSLSYVLIFFWQCLTLGVLGWAFRQSSPSREKMGAFLLGLATVAGFYIYPPAWAVNALLVSLAAAVFGLRPGRYGWSFLLVFGFSFVLFLTPLAIEFHLQGYGGHIRSLWPGSALLTVRYIFFVGLPYLTQIFWGNGENQMLYGPGWGGFLNPISTALFLLGVFAIWVLWGTGKAWLVVGAFLLFLLPGFFSNGVEMMRVENLIPLLLVVMAFGIQALTAGFKARWKTMVLVLLLFSTGFSFYHLTVPFANTVNPGSPHFGATRSEESLNSYEVIRSKALKDGPGLLFLDFLYCPLDQTLYLATFPYNAGMNPRLKEAKPAWACFLVNINYVPFLKKELPHAQWFVVNPKTTPWVGQLVLGVFDLNVENRELVARWSKAEPAFHQVAETAYQLPVDETGERLMEPLVKDYPAIRGDRYLESAFWEAVYFNRCRDKKFPEAYEALSMILKQGYPAAHIYNEMGVYFFAKHDLKKSQSSFQTAVRLGGDHTDAADNLKRVDKLMK